MKQSGHHLDRYRKQHPMLGSSPDGALWGYFRVGDLFIISSGSADGQHEFSEGWEHVSVSLARRCPTWEEMDRVARLFWEPEDTVMQLHPPRSKHINNHRFTLHLWRPTRVEIPMPPQICV